ncbi:MAG: hypothetical protein DRJ11_11880 [Candidatus Aminicenantes bacterium]|nr:MAG: hypothetical protein DRJ11_11880 [Candidatus Aminicenantes bacterium]
MKVQTTLFFLRFFLYYLAVLDQALRLRNKHLLLNSRFLKNQHLLPYSPSLVPTSFLLGKRQWLPSLTSSAN